MMKQNCIFPVYLILILIGIVAVLLPFFPCLAPCASYVSGISGGIAIIVSALAANKTDKYAAKLDSALNVKRGKQGDVEELMIDGGEY